ncbi:putative nuclease HARBI1 [Sinocyclocheilus rhinocerous]|uniref:putative nuclease HARBI1 n=1 Tax=Sinocyclocheilus rhinocerous TaxID=307959 RepID=UPI0007BA9846|nr:PREDICTED: putative nuclease HARBI1 [Sinocyclocheilus rhinocerous]
MTSGLNIFVCDDTHIMPNKATVHRQFINLPKGEKLQAIVEGFKDRWGFPQCAGAIDGSHIPITPPFEDAKDYFNRKGSYSIILQAVIDHNSLFTNINVRWPGSVHDARVLRNSTLFHLAENGDLFAADTQEIECVNVPIMLLGDPAYPLLSWLMKGFPDTGNLSREHRRFSYRLSRARMTVECAFGQLKGEVEMFAEENGNRYITGSNHYEQLLCPTQLVCIAH